MNDTKSQGNKKESETESEALQFDDIQQMPISKNFRKK